MNKRITADEIIALEPCWTPKRVRSAVGRGITFLQIAEDDSVSFAERRWVLTRLGVRTPAGLKAVRLWAIGCAQDAIVVMPTGDAQDASLGAISEALDLVEGVGDVNRCRATAYAAAADAVYAVTYAAYAATYAAYAATYAVAAAAAVSAAVSAAATYAAAAAAAATAYAATAAASNHLAQLAAALEAL